MPAVLLASRTAATVTFGGSSAIPMTDVVYYPNTAVLWGGSTAPGGSSGCLQLIAKSVTATGSTSMASNCGSYGAASAVTGAAAQAMLKR